ncbi:MAG: copper homeostasis protein CutC [Spirochaetaceae bacterium]|jgi:copper homeostasis protein|nr:copper homeostasis protein CutC [Spirochaetaceae bacterium]
MKPFIEICAVSPELCAEAWARGARRVELCRQLDVGGLTPSYAEIRAAREAAPQLAINVLVRPRAGDFVYTKSEQEIMFRDIEACQKAGVNGVVLGCLRSDGSLDYDLLKAFCSAAGQGGQKPLSVTFHRAIDAARDPLGELRSIKDCGCERILSSGGKNSAEYGTALLKQMVELGRACGLAIMPGGGIRASNLPKIAQETGAAEFHSSSLEVLDVEL